MGSAAGVGARSSAGNAAHRQVTELPKLNSGVVGHLHTFEILPVILQTKFLSKLLYALVVETVGHLHMDGGFWILLIIAVRPGDGRGFGQLFSLYNIVPEIYAATALLKCSKDASRQSSVWISNISIISTQASCTSARNISSAGSKV